MNLNLNASAGLPQQSGNDVVGLLVLKKALSIEAQNAQTLLDAVPSPQKNASNLPPNLGQNINTTA